MPNVELLFLSILTQTFMLPSKQIWQHRGKGAPVWSHFFKSCLPCVTMTTGSYIYPLQIVTVQVGMGCFQRMPLCLNQV